MRGRSQYSALIATAVLFFSLFFAVWRENGFRSNRAHTKLPPVPQCFKNEKDLEMCNGTHTKLLYHGLCCRSFRLEGIALSHKKAPLPQGNYHCELEVESHLRDCLR